MENLTALTNAMNRLEAQIAIEQKYILQHGASNDAGEFDAQWEQYKVNAQYNLNKWDAMKAQRTALIA